MTAAYRPHADWRREDRERKPLDTFWQARITGASDEVLTQWLGDARDSENVAWVDALIDEAASRWYVRAMS